MKLLALPTCICVALVGISACVTVAIVAYKDVEGQLPSYGLKA